MSNHRLCDHPATPAARRACRKQHEENCAAAVVTNSTDPKPNLEMVRTHLQGVHAENAQKFVNVFGEAAAKYRKIAARDNDSGATQCAVDYECALDTLKRRYAA